MGAIGAERFMNSLLQKFVYKGSLPGKNFLLLGGIHGNEVCGPAALQWLVKQLDSDGLRVVRGQLSILPVCNPEAKRLNARQVNANLNRMIKHYPTPKMIEEKYANELFDHIGQADYVIDLHSFHAHGEPFVFLDSLKDSWAELALSSDLRTVVVGWDKLYPDDGSEVDTVTCARLQGGIGITVECGFHGDRQSTDTGIHSVTRILSHYGVCDFQSVSSNNLRQVVYEVDRIVKKKKPGSLMKNWKNMEKVTKGQIVSKYFDGERVVAPFDGYVFLPNAECDVGNEWLYFAKSKPGQHSRVQRLRSNLFAVPGATRQMSDNGPQSGE